jgi:DNA-binding transcriptional ArsR family regulator
VAIRFLFGEQAEEAVAFAYSPVEEAVLSLHVLVEPKHHPLQHAWARRLRRLDPSLRAEIRAFKFAYRESLPDFLAAAPDAELQTFEDGLAALDGLAPSELAFEFLRPLWDHGGSWPRDPSLLESDEVRAHAVESAEKQGDGGGELATLIFDDPAELGRRFRALLERYWEAAFAAEWERLEPILAGAVEDAGQLISEHGLFALLARMRPRLLVEPEKRLAWIKIPHEHDVTIDQENPLVLTPSYFVWPHVRVNCDPPYPPGLVYAPAIVAEQADPPIPSGELLRVLRAVSDETRLRALALIAERPRSTQELAPLVGISEAGLSKHLRTLADAGVVEAHRDGYYVLYSIVRERLRPLSRALLDYLDAP